MSIFTHFLNKKVDNKIFLILCIDDYKIRAVIIQIENNILKVEGKGECDLSKSENLSEVADFAVSEAEKNISSDMLIQNVVFALPSEYLDQGVLKPQLVSNLKKIAADLDLKPAGYIEYPSAISNFLEKEEGSPPTFLLLHVGEKHHTLSFIRIGKIQQEITIKSASSVASDLHKSLNGINSDILPARIIIYDGKRNLDEVKEELLTLPWNKHPSFLHTPKIEIFDSQKVVTAVTDAAGTSLFKEIHPSISDEENLPKPQDISDPDRIETASAIPEIDKTTETVISTEIIPDENTPAEHFGFTREHKSTPQKETGHKDIKTHTEIVESLFPKKLKDQEIVESSHHGQDPMNIRPEIPKPDVSGNNQPGKNPFTVPKLKLPSFSLPDYSLVFPVLSVSFIVLVISLILFFMYYYYPKATVNLYVAPLKKNSREQIFLTKDPKVKENNNEYILINAVSQEVTGDKTSSATGKIKVGEKSKGEVTIYNKTSGSKKFPKGTIITGNKLQFAFDNEISIASASETGEGLIFGKTTAAVTSLNIGPENNLPQDVAFSFKDFPESSFTAKNSKPFSGGSSRDVTSISKEDRIQLENDLTNELVNRANDLVTEKIGSSESIIASLSDKEITGKKFSAETGSEAKEISLSLSLKSTVYTYDKKELFDTIGKRIQIPAGYTADIKRFYIKLDNIKTDKNGNISSIADVTLFLLPEINQQEILKSIAGKKYTDVENYLKSVDFIAGVKIIKDNNSPLIGNRLPLPKNNITMAITAQ